MEIYIEFYVLVEIVPIEKISVEIFYYLLGFVYHVEKRSEEHFVFILERMGVGDLNLLYSVHQMSIDQICIGSIEC